MPYPWETGRGITVYGNLRVSKKCKKLGNNNENIPLRVFHIPTNTTYTSIMQAAKHFNIRRNTLGDRLRSGSDAEFKFL
jgi:hypothetical protein